MIPGGGGPWFAALLFNTSTTSKKQTHLIAHTSPHLAADILNRGHSDDKDNFWVIILKVGPFQKWSECLSYISLWTTQTRGRERRLERGVELFKMYWENYRLTMWIQDKARDEMINELKKSKTQQYEQSSGKKRLVTNTIAEPEQMRDIFDPNEWDKPITIGMIKLHSKKTKIH